MTCFCPEPQVRIELTTAEPSALRTESAHALLPLNRSARRRPNTPKNPRNPRIAGNQTATRRRFGCPECGRASAPRRLCAPCRKARVAAFFPSIAAQLAALHGGAA